MPTYEYRCDKCGCEFEEFQRMTDRPLKTCPKCRGKVRRLVSGGSGVIFKGSGFYATDYARKSVKSNDSSGVADPKKDFDTKKVRDRLNKDSSPKQNSDPKKD